MVQILRDGFEERRRWADYFQLVLNVKDLREENIKVVVDRGMPVLGELNKRTISIVAVRESVNKMTSGKTPSRS